MGCTAISDCDHFPCSPAQRSVPLQTHLGKEEAVPDIPLPPDDVELPRDDVVLPKDDICFRPTTSSIHGAPTAVLPVPIT